MSMSAQALEGFRVIASSGRLIGRVAGDSEDVIVVTVRRWGRVTLRPLPKEYALVWTRTRTVIAQISARELRHAPPVRS
jgi:hypothetical protein